MSHDNVRLTADCYWQVLLHNVILIYKKFKMEAMSKIIAFFILALSVLQMFIITTVLAATNRPRDHSSFKSKDFGGFHLPNIVKPIHYDIKLILVDNDNFYGETNISLLIFENTKNISFYSDRLGVNHKAITLSTGNNGTVYAPTGYDYDIDTQVNNIYFGNWLVPRKYYIVIKFTGTINNDPNDKEGFFKSSYINDGNEKIWLFTTFFRGIGARRVFPCWDEPALRATFKITIKHSNQFSALSNVPLKEIDTSEDGMTWSRFDVTPDMSPCHVSIVLYDTSSFHIVKTSNESIAMMCPLFIKEHDVQFAQGIAKSVTQYLRKIHTNVSWWQPNLTHIAIPNFPLDTMENNAFALYRAEDIIYDAKLDTINHKLKIARLVSRKVMYHWFGNAFNPFTWSYLWIGEGLCTLLSMEALTKKRSELRIADYYIGQMQHDSFHLDTHSVMNPLIMNVGPNETDALFSFQYYLKASLILRMVEETMGTDLFWKNIKRYLNEMFGKFTNEKPFLNFWEDTQTAIAGFNVPGLFNIPLHDAMYIWTTRRSYPVLNVTRNYDSGDTTIELLSTRSSDSNKWYIYVSYATETVPTFNYTEVDRAVWFTSFQKEYSFSADDIDDWIIVNLRQIGYYRVLYDERNWKRLARYLKDCNFDKIHVLNRAQIVDDAYYLMMEGYLDFSMFVELTEFLGTQEKDYVAWYPMIKAFEYMSSYLPYPESAEIREHMTNILVGALHSIKYLEKPYEEELTKCLRYELLKWACIVNHEACKTKALTELNNYLINPEQYEFVAGMKEWTICNGLRIARPHTWYKILDIWRVNRDQKILQLLTCSEDPDIIYNYLKLPMSDHNITKMNPIDHINSFFLIIARHARNEIVLQFILRNLQTVKPTQVNMSTAYAVIINYVYSVNHLTLIHDSAKSELTNETLENIERKIEDRVSQIVNQTVKFQRLARKAKTKRE